MFIGSRNVFGCMLSLQSFVVSPLNVLFRAKFWCTVYIFCTLKLVLVLIS